MLSNDDIARIAHEASGTIANTNSRSNHTATVSNAIREALMMQYSKLDLRVEAAVVLDLTKTH